MNDSTTRARLIEAALGLFAERGYDGTSIRAITQAAGANLGAVTYHFGSKAALFEAVLSAVITPLREGIASGASTTAPPLDRIAAIVRAFFDHFQRQPAMPQLMLHVLATPQHVPAAVQLGLAANHAMLTATIEEGQRDGSIRPGDARLMALSIATQPVMLALIRRVLTEALGVDQDDPETRRQLVTSVSTFVHAGLSAPGGSP